MDLAMSPHLATWCVAGLATLGVIVRPFGWPEAVWAVAGAALLLLLGLIGIDAVAEGVMRGFDVYLFLIGMMLVADVARREGLFDWLAVFAVRHSRGSAARLFLLVYVVGAFVTAFLSNDATAVVLTPAVYAAARAAKSDPLPHLFVCAFIANAASFVLPISNPANLVVYADRMPPLGEWLTRFALPSALSILVTYAALRFTQRKALAEPISADVAPVRLGATGRVAGAGVILTALVLTASSALGLELGPPTLACGVATALAVVAMRRSGAVDLVTSLSWSVLPLVGGLLVLVVALERTGAIAALAGVLKDAAAASEQSAAWGAGLAVALASNLMNNLPAGLIAASAVQEAGAPPDVAAAALIGVDLGPNLSITGSLATILWLTALRREGLDVSAWAFLKLGAVVMPPALLAALGALLLTG